MGYKGVESTELVFDGYRCPAENILGGEEAGLNKGFAQMMDALEVGRANVAARGVGIAQRALELALRYSQERKTFGKPIAQHQAIQFKLADMATQVEAARLLTLRAARMKDAGERSDLEAGMAKLFASEAGRFCVEESFRIHGGYGYSKEYEIERLYRDAPLLLIGEGTSEIQRMVIGKKLLQRHKIWPRSTGTWARQVVEEAATRRCEGRAARPARRLSTRSARARYCAACPAVRMPPEALKPPRAVVAHRLEHRARRTRGGAPAGPLPVEVLTKSAPAAERGAAASATVARVARGTRLEDRLERRPGADRLGRRTTRRPIASRSPAQLRAPRHDDVDLRRTRAHGGAATAAAVAGSSSPAGKFADRGEAHAGPGEGAGDAAQPLRVHGRRRRPRRRA